MSSELKQKYFGNASSSERQLEEVRGPLLAQKLQAHRRPRALLPSVDRGCFTFQVSGIHMLENPSYSQEVLEAVPLRDIEK